VKQLNSALVELIRARIQETGPVSFAWFMEQALYHPDHGYYASGRAKLGRHGDFFTNVSVGPVFGKLMAVQFAEVWRRMGQPDEFTIVEQGAHGGEMATDVLNALAEKFPECFQSVRYRIVERFKPLQEQQRLALARFQQKIHWCCDLDALEPFTGIHFSNELLDAMPVYVVRRRLHASGADDWVEKLVEWKDDRFGFVDGPITDDRLQRQLERFADVPPDTEIEINLAALDWFTALAAKLDRGYVLAVDYGFIDDDLHAPQHRSGTLQVRANHRVLNSPFEAVGESDITAHVHWTAIAAHAQEQGFRIHGFADQHHFLTGIISSWPDAGEADASGRRQLQTLVHPEIMGRAFQVLGLTRGLTDAEPLSGFKFARPAHRQLG